MKESIAIIVNTVTGIGLSTVGIIGLVVHDVSIPIALFVFLLIIGIINLITGICCIACMVKDIQNGYE